jgi:CHAT domain-containing protein
VGRYIDPIDTIYIDTPVGWCHHRYSSMLTQLVFVPWNSLDESLHVSVHPPQVPVEARFEAWLAWAAKFIPADVPLTRLDSRDGMAVMATLHGTHRVTRFAFVRGLRLVATVEHRGARDDPASIAILRDAAASLFIPVNHQLPSAPDEVRGRQLFHDFKAAMGRDDSLRAVQAMHEALDIWRKAWLLSLLSPSGLPDLNAADSVVLALVSLSKLGPDVVLLRQAEEIALRLRRFVPRLGLPDNAAKEWNVRSKLVLDAIKGLQLNIFRSPDEASTTQLLDARAGYLSNAAQSSLKSDAKEASNHARIALEDYLLELAHVGHQIGRTTPPQQVPIGGDDIAVDAILKAYRSNIAKNAGQAAHILYVHAMDRQDAAAAREASTLLVDMTELLVTENAKDEDHRAHAIAMLAHAGALLFSPDDASLKEADALLDRVRAVLDVLAPEPWLRAEYCRDHAWLKHYRRDAAGGTALCEEGLAALQDIPTEERPDLFAKMQRSLASLHSQFLLNADRVTEALAAARIAVDTDTPISSNLLNLALCEDKVGLHNDALRSLRRALEVALPDNPLGQDVLRILFVASALTQLRKLDVSLDLHDAADALLDAQRALFAGADVKIAFDEASHHLEVAQTLVGRLIDAGDLGAALEAADRSRARVLIDLLDAPPAREPEALGETDAVEKAPQLAADPLQAFPASAAFVRKACAKSLRDAGAFLPLDRVTLVETVRRTGRPALLFQPERNRVHMFCIVPEGGVIVAESPLPLTEIESAIGAAQSALGVFAVARARSGGRLKLADVDDDQASALDDALDTLSQALIAPLTDLLAREKLLPLVLSQRGLTLVPYRQLALIPFALLPAPTGRLLIEEAPLSQVPSIATLRALCVRKRPAPRRCLVYGAPTVDPRHEVEPLPGAATEAASIADLLVRARAVSDDFRARVGGEATEPAYRADSLDAALVHLACHAAAREPASQSALYLAPSAAHDGLLVPHEIAEGQLANALVFLSACQTGLGRPTADGVIGLGRAFLQAGALSTILSLWRVFDVAAAYLAAYFYRAALGIEQRAVPVAMALQVAMLATRDAIAAGRIRTAEGEVLKNHPAHWAPFALLGEASLHLRDTLAGIKRVYQE